MNRSMTGSAPRIRPVLALVLLFACKEATVTEVPVDVDRIDLSAPQNTVLEGQSLQLNAVPRSASGQGLTARSITWSSSNPGIARAENGVVTGVSPGEAQITAAAGGKSASVGITVTPAPRIQLSVTTLAFSGTAGGADPAARTVTITNSGAGTLSGLRGEITYAAGQPTNWLEGNFDQAVPATAPTTVTLRVRLAGLTAGSFTATVAFTSPVARNSPQNVTVQLTVAPGPTPPVLTTVSYGLVEVNAPAASCGGLVGASRFQHTISYTDAGGDVTDPIGGVWTYLFNDEFVPTALPFTAVRNGTGAAGTFQLFTCYRFGTATSVRQSVVILDEEGDYGDPVVVDFPKPAGANSPATGASAAGAVLQQPVGGSASARAGSDAVRPIRRTP